MNPGTGNILRYTSNVVGNQGTGQPASSVSTSVNTGTGNIPRYTSTGAGNQGTGQPVSSVVTLVNPGTGNIPRYSNCGAGNQGQLSDTQRSTSQMGDRNGSVNATRATGQSDSSRRDQSSYLNL